MENKNIWVVDIETNGLPKELIDYSSFPYKLKKKKAHLWCTVFRNLDGEVVSFKEKEISKEKVKDLLQNAEILIAHNGIKFDFPILSLFGVLDYEIGGISSPDLLFGREITIVDTLIYSRISSPDRYGGHSIEAWGERVGSKKMNFRRACEEAGLIKPEDAPGKEFTFYSDIMLEYCIQDTVVNSLVYKELLKELRPIEKWTSPIKMENRLAHLSFRRENLGFYFDKNLALKHLDDLENKMDHLAKEVDPLLPLKPMNKTELKEFTPPKTQISVKGLISSFMLNFAERIGGEIIEKSGSFFLSWEKNEYPLPILEPLKTFTPGKITDLDHVKMYLIDLGWIPTEWRERDLTKDAKKQSLPVSKRFKAFERWLEETFEGKYKNNRLEYLGFSLDITKEEVYEIIAPKLDGTKPVKVPTSPSIRVGVEKNLCSNLESLGEEVAFAKQFSDYLTYKSRKSNIAGGEIDDTDIPEKGYLSTFREEDERIPTPSIEIGAISHRYKHIVVANIPRASSLYGAEMRSLFGAGHNKLQIGFDFSSLEARIMGHYVWNYTKGQELAQMFLAEKPNDWHSLSAIKYGISRSETKSVNYAIIYGSSANKISQMLKISKKRGEEILNSVWENAPALKELKDKAEDFWEKTGKKYIIGIDGRKIFIRSKHSIINFLFQSAGVICAKYVTCFIEQELREQGFMTDPFKGDPDFCSMIEYHDEAQFYANPSLVELKYFTTEEKCNEFISNWSGKQLSNVYKGKDGLYQIGMPNPLSVAIENSIRKTEKLLNLNVSLGFTWDVGNNWYECH